MKLSRKTIEVFKYFSSLSPQILVREGNVLRARNGGKTISAKAVLEESFPQNFIIYSIPEFLKTINLFNEPDIEFNDTHLTIEEGALKVRYMYADEVLYKNAPANQDYEPANVGWSLSLDLSEDDLSNLQKAANVLSLDTISFTQDGIVLFSASNPGANNFKMGYTIAPDIKSVDRDSPDTFSINFPSESFNLFSGAYKAEFSCGTIVGEQSRTSLKLTNEEANVTVWLAATTGSIV
jgi:hypothetical protein